MKYFDKKEFVYMPTVTEYIDYACQKFANNTAFVIKEKDESGKNVFTDITYKKMLEDIHALSESMIEKDLCGKNIAILGVNCYEWVITYLSVMSIGSVVVPLDALLGGDDIKSYIEFADVSAIFYTKKMIDKLEGVKADVKHFHLDGKEENSVYELINAGNALIADGSHKYSEVVLDKDATAALLFTSGTTAVAKTVMLTQNNLASNIYDLVKMLDLYPTDVNTVVLPLHHTLSSTGVLLFLVNGVKNAFVSGLKIKQAFADYKPTVLVCVPLIAEKLQKTILKTAEASGKIKTMKFALKLGAFLEKFGIDIRKKLFGSVYKVLGGNLRLVICGGAALEPSIHKWFDGIGLKVLQGYGLTETSPVLSAERVGKNRWGSVGFPMSHVEIEIENPNEFGIGEIKAKGPNVMKGYYKNLDATDEVLKDGWFYTGDLGYIDSDGYLFITGRHKNVIVLKNGKNVYPEEIEMHLTGLIYVTECLVYESDDGLSVSANIVYDKEYFKDKPLNEVEKIIKSDVESINEKLSSYKRLKDISISTDPMLKTSTSKIKRKENVEILKTR